MPFFYRNFLLFIFFLGLSLCVTLQSQHIAESYQQIIKEYNEADKIYWAGLEISTSEKYTEGKEEALNKKALYLFSTLEHKLNSTHFDSLHFFTLFKKGELLHYFDSTDKALNSYQQALSIQNKVSVADSFLFKPLLYAGIIYFGKNNFDSAFFYFREAEKLQLKYNNKLTETERLYNTLGAMYYETGNYKQAKNYFEKAAEILPKSHPYYKELLVNYKSNLASVLIKLEAFEQARIIYDQLLKFGVSTNEIYHNKGTIELASHHPDQAVSYFKKAHYTNSNQIRLLNDIGYAYFQMGRKDSALFFYDKANKENKTLFGNKPNVPHGLTLKLYGDMLLSENKPTEALNQYQQSLHHFYPDFTDTAIAANPATFSGVFSYLNLFHALTAKADALQVLYQQYTEKSIGDKELETYEAAYRLIDYVAKSYNSDEARIFLSKIKYLVHGKPIKIALQLFEQTKENKYLETAYVFDQKNKAATLVLNQYKIATETTRNTAFLNKEKQLKDLITRLSIKGSQVTNENVEKEIDKKIRDAEMELDKVQQKAKEENDGSIHTETIPSIKKLQQNLLDNKTAVLSYHLSDTSLVIFCITKKDFRYKEQKLDTLFYKKLTIFIQQLHLIENNLHVMVENEFRAMLIPDSMVSDIERLIIIPDGLLSYVPFEALKWGDEYLINKCGVTYQYSTALLQKETFDFSNSHILGLAPFSNNSYSDSSNNDFNQLPQSSSEFSDLKGFFFTDTAATKQKFIQQYPSFSILHIATHAVVNDSLANLSFIAFAPFQKRMKEDYLLYAQEIYNLSLKNNKLVILSACETGYGNYINGEGIMSLSRAFASAGCPNILTSLWKADDETTAYIIHKFHMHLKNGQSIDKALQNAKCDYLADKSINPRKKQPSFWAHLVFIGNYKPGETTNWFHYILIGLVAIGLMGWIIKKPVITGFGSHR